MLPIQKYIHLQPTYMFGSCEQYIFENDLYHNEPLPANTALYITHLTIPRAFLYH